MAAIPPRKDRQNVSDRPSHRQEILLCKNSKIIRPGLGAVAAAQYLGNFFRKRWERHPNQLPVRRSHPHYLALDPAAGYARL